MGKRGAEATAAGGRAKKAALDEATIEHELAQARKLQKCAEEARERAEKAESKPLAAQLLQDAAARVEAESQFCSEEQDDEFKEHEEQEEQEEKEAATQAYTPTQVLEQEAGKAEQKPATLTKVKKLESKEEASASKTKGGMAQPVQFALGAIAAGGPSPLTAMKASPPVPSSWLPAHPAVFPRAPEPAPAASALPEPQAKIAPPASGPPAKIATPASGRTGDLQNYTAKQDDCAKAILTGADTKAVKYGYELLSRFLDMGCAPPECKDKWKQITAGPGGRGGNKNALKFEFLKNMMVNVQKGTTPFSSSYFEQIVRLEQKEADSNEGEWVSLESLIQTEGNEARVTRMIQNQMIEQRPHKYDPKNSFQYRYVKDKDLKSTGVTKEVSLKQMGTVDGEQAEEFLGAAERLRRIPGLDTVNF